MSKNDDDMKGSEEKKDKLPINIMPMIPILLGVWARVQPILSRRQMTVAETIDLLAATAHSAAKQYGVHNKVIVVAEGAESSDG